MTGLIEHTTRFLADAGAAALGGLALTGGLFWLGERVFPIPRLSGRWFVQTHFEWTARAPYENMYLKREIFVWQEGSTVHGTSEKIYENSSTGLRQYDGTHRARGSVSGVANRYFFAKNRVRLHLEEKTGDRVSTTYFDLIWPKDSLIKRLVGLEHREKNSKGLIQESRSGIFQTTAGSSSGSTLWCRDRYDAKFESSVANEVSAVYGGIVQMDAETGLQEPIS